MITETRFSVMPTVTSDSTKGYSVGDKWRDQSNNVMYECTDNKVGVAQWKVIATDLPETRSSSIGRVMNVDGSRTDTYAADGSESYPFKSLALALVAIKADYAATVDKQDTKYVVRMFPGTYSDAITIDTVKHLRIEGTGVTLSGTITIAQSPISGSGQEPYTRIEFIGMDGWRAEKGVAFQISGNISFTRTNDSLTYLTLKGCYVTGSMLFDTDGTFVVQSIGSYISGAMSTGTFADADSAVLLESVDFARFACSITGKFSLYNCDLSEFSGAIAITPVFDSRITNCKFSSSISIVANKNLTVDANSLKAILARTPLLTGMTLVQLDADTVILPDVNVVNAVAADVGSLTVVSRPDDYIANVYSSLETALVGDNNDLRFVARATGVAGDSVEIAYVDPGAEGALGIGVVGTVITVTLANSAVPAITTTSAEIISLIEATPAATALVDVVHKAGNTGAGVVTALVQTPLAGGVDEVKSYLTIASKDYIFSASEGNDPSTDYPDAYDVRTAGAASMDDIAAALVLGLEADGSHFAAADVSSTGAVITAKYLIKGTIGNAVTCENHLVVGTDITSARFTAGLLAGGIDGTPGYAGMLKYHGTGLKLCTSNDYSVSNAGWLSVTLS